MLAKAKRLKLVRSALIVLSALANVADAGKVDTRIDSIPSGATTSSSYRVVHHSSASEAQGAGDFSFLEGPTPALDIYEVTSWAAPQDKLSQNASDPGNMNSRTSEVHGRGLSGLTDAELTTTTSEIAGENNFVNKEMTKTVYDCKTDPCGVLVGSYDTKALDKSGITIPLQVQNGLSYKVVDSFDSSTSWVRSDADRDGIVSLDDFEVLSKFYGKDCSTIVSPQDSYDCFSIDTNDDGVIGMADVINLASDWLQDE